MESRIREIYSFMEREAAMTMKVTIAADTTNWDSTDTAINETVRTLTRPPIPNFVLFNIEWFPSIIYMYTLKNKVNQIFEIKCLKHWWFSMALPGLDKVVACSLTRNEINDLGHLGIFFLTF